MAVEVQNAATEHVLGTWRTAMPSIARAGLIKSNQIHRSMYTVTGSGIAKVLIEAGGSCDHLRGARYSRILSGNTSLRTYEWRLAGAVTPRGDP